MAIHEKLSEAKQNGVRVIILDVDGTIVDPKDSRYDLASAVRLICDIVTHGISVGVITARDASFRKFALPKIKLFLEKKNSTIPLLVAYANGTTAEIITKNTIRSLYSYSLTQDDISYILRGYDSSIKKLSISKSDLNQQALSTFELFIKKNWESYIPTYYLKLAKQYEGKLFIESSKLSIVLPSDGVQRNILKKELTKRLCDHFVIRGDTEFTHITKQIIVNNEKCDGKYFAAQNFLREIKCNKKHVTAFGDSPDDNDKELLSKFPYGFTNNASYSGTKPPYILPGERNVVGKIYQAVNYLLS